MRPSLTETSIGPQLLVRAFVRRFRTEILAMWRRDARAIPVAHDLSPVTLIDHIPEVLDEIAEIAEQIEDSTFDATCFESARRHALDRLGEGFDVSAVVKEMSLLRACIAIVWEREHGGRHASGLRALHRAIDLAIEASVTRYAEARERSLAGVDRISTATLEAHSIDDLLQRLLAVFHETTPAVETAAILLIERGGYRVHAHVGYDGDASHGSLFATPDEFAAALRSRGTHALYGVQLDHHERVIGVAYMGSKTAHTFSHEDRQFFDSLVARATVGIVHQLLRHEAKRAQQALAEEQQRLEAIVEHAPAAIWVVDASGRIVLANHKLAQAIGVDSEELIGRTSDEVLPPPFAMQHAEHDRMVLEQQRAIEVEERTPSPTGERTFLTVKFPIPHDPPLVGGIATEITERKRMEQDLRVAIRGRDDMLAVVSHDLRNPLGTVQLASTVLLDQHGDDARSRRHIEMISRACSRMENLIDDLLDTASIRAGRLQIERKPERIVDVVTEALDLQQPLAAEKTVTLDRALDLDDVEIDVDRHRILQVFGNLIGNAIKFCRAGDTITVTGRHDAHQLVFSVHDTGPGIPPESLPQLFEPYWSGPAHAKQGSGLGLYIVRGIVESHGGRVWAESEPGEGARFIFTLPRTTP